MRLARRLWSGRGGTSGETLGRWLCLAACDGHTDGRRASGGCPARRYRLDMTRDEAIRVGIFTLADWHRRDHGQRCVCLEGEQLGAQTAAMVDALAAEGMSFDGYTGTGRGTLGPPQ